MRAKSHIWLVLLTGLMAGCMSGPHATVVSTAMTPTVRVVPCPSVGDGYYPYPTPLPSATHPFAFRMADGTILYQGRVAFTLATGGIFTGYAVYVENTGVGLIPLDLRDFTPILVNPADGPAAIIPSGRSGLIQAYPGESGYSPDFAIRSGAGSRPVAFSGIRWRMTGSDDTVEIPYEKPAQALVIPTRSC